MDSRPEPLASQEHQRLIEIIGREAPDLLPLASDAVNSRWLSTDECEALTRILQRVFLDSRDKDDEPSREGAEADDLVGRIEMQREDYWR